MLADEDWELDDSIEQERSFLDFDEPFEDQLGPDCHPSQEDSLVLPVAETPAAAAPVHDAVVCEPREPSEDVLPELHSDTVPAQGVRHKRFRCKTSVAMEVQHGEEGGFPLVVG